MMTLLCASQVKNEKMSQAFVLGEAVPCDSRHEDVLLPRFDFGYNSLDL